MNIKSIILNIVYGKPRLIRTENAPGIITVTMRLPSGETERFESIPKQDVWKRPRQKQVVIKGVYLRLSMAIPFPHVISYHSDWEEI